MANKILASIKSISPKMWLIMAGALLLMIFISRAKGGGAASVVASSGDSTITRDAINQMQEATKSNSAALQNNFKEELTKQAAENGKLFDALKASFSTSLATLKGDINNVTNQLQKQPDYSSKFAQYDETLSNIGSSIGGLSNSMGGMSKQIGESNAIALAAQAGQSSQVATPPPAPTVKTPSAVEQMQNNSGMWNNASDYQRQILNQENQRLALSIGATYNQQEGSYYKDGKVLY